MHCWFALLLVAGLILPISSPAGEPASGPDLDGMWALQFQITNNFTLDDFQGSIISIKRHTSDRSAWRAGLSLDFDSSSVERSVQPDGAPAFTDADDGSNQGARLDLQYLRYTRAGSPVRFLFGGGPFAGISHSSTESYRDGVTYRKDERDRWDAGVSGVLGAEWFVGAGLSLHAEYGFEFGYTQQERRSEVPTTGEMQKIETDRVAFSARGVLFGVSAYF